jgi:hypothetical protein
VGEVASSNLVVPRQALTTCVKPDPFEPGCNFGGLHPPGEFSGADQNQIREIPVITHGVRLLSICVQAAGVFGGFILGTMGFPLLPLIFACLIRQGGFDAAVEDAVLAIPVFGWLHERIFKPNTFYKMDTALIFQSAVQVYLSGESRPSLAVFRPLLRTDRNTARDTL